MRVGIEVGGTFTDLIAIEEDRVQVIKVPSTPSSPEIGAMDALRFSGIDIRSIKELAHGSTVATNAVLERKGGKTAFITTSGFRDILLLQRHGRTRIYDLAYQKPVPVVDRASSYEVSERVLADGSVIELLDQEDVRLHLIPELLGSGYVAVAICLLNSYVNPTHEILLRDILKECAPDIFVTVSSDISREFREYERASTTTLSAYVQPVMERYITNFEELLSREGFSGKFSIMQSNGGRVPGGAMRNQAITALLSGPAAGVTGALHQAKRSGFENLITLDMGGTSTDVCVIANGKAQLTQEYEIGGLPVRIPVTDINTVGAGGGSIIWLDEGGMLRVGPHSAGADPGPACYGRGGRLPTITDAHVVRKTIRAEALLGGRMALSTAAAFSSMESIAEKLGMTVEETADSAIRLADANIVRAIQLISTERGLDPRDFVLVPFGGAGPLHATAVAEELGICRILVPPNSGVISAFGLLASDFATYESLTRRVPLDPASPIVVLKLLSEMKERAFLRSDAMGIGRDCAVSFTIGMRFVGQAYEIPVEIDLGSVETCTDFDLRSSFQRAHHAVFHFGTNSNRPVEMVSFRLGLMSGGAVKPVLTEPAGAGSSSYAVKAFIRGAWRDGKLMQRSSLPRNREISGLAIFEDTTSTLLVPEPWRLSRDEHDNILLTREERHD